MWRGAGHYTLAFLEPYPRFLRATHSTAEVIEMTPKTLGDEVFWDASLWRLETFIRTRLPGVTTGFISAIIS